MTQYIVDAFTNQIFCGNPAAVCVMDKWPEDKWMMQVAAENNLSETAFIVKESAGYRLRWFTPGTEVELCGHATLASAFVILNFYDQDKNQLEFHTKSGILTVYRKDNLYEMDFPTYELTEISVTDAMAEAFGVPPIKAILGLDLICIFENEEIIRKITPNQSLLMKLDGRIQNITAKGDLTDCVSRSFCPKLSIAEDPVCGSAHCQIADYWSKELNKDHIVAYQASKRGGTLYCHLTGNGRIQISGEAALFAVSELQI
jgi:PhzF family phenazine biosynthesis protein